MKGSNMNDEAKTLPLMVVVFFLILSTIFQCCFSCAYQPLENRKMKIQTLMSTNRFGSTVFFPASGSVYKGYYSVTLEIGNPPVPFMLDIDTASDLTWIQCDAPYINLHPAHHNAYKTSEINVVLCKDPQCSFVQQPPEHPCNDPNDQCYYVIEYADGSSSVGILVRDSFPLHFASGLAAPSLTFGCGFNQRFPTSSKYHFTDGVLGLASSKVSIVSQLRAQLLTQNVFGHCLHVPYDGFLFFGADIVPPRGTVWAPMAKQHESECNYSPGVGDLFFDGESTDLKNLDIVFDSGCTYTYFNDQAYKATLSIVMESLSETPLRKSTTDTFLPVCWEGLEPFLSIEEVKKYFKNLSLIFSKVNKVQFPLPPEAYLIISKLGNVCLGILDGAQVNFGDMNVIGDISLQDKLVIYDNERKLIGWVPSKCNLKVDHDSSTDFSQPNVTNFSRKLPRMPYINKLEL